MADYFLKTTNRAGLLSELGIQEMPLSDKYQDDNFILDYIGIIKKYDDEGNVIEESDSDRLNIRTFNSEYESVIEGLENAETITPPEVPYRLFS
jgi:hypothetical protein